MIVKFLYTSGPNGHYPAVGYSTGKVDKNKGELMKAANFGPLQALGQLRPQDYKNYLKMVSATNKAVKKPQLHVAISGEGKSYDKHELTEIATQWLEKMGYGKQPYLIIFHKDTRNNHVHIVSTRVDKQGKKISDSYEQIKGQQRMNMVMGLDEKHSASADVEKALTYCFGTKAQFMMILERQGYTLREIDSKFQIIKFGRQQGEVDLSLVEERLKNYLFNVDRKTQLKALFHKYAAVYSTSLNKERTAYASEFSARLKEKFGIDLVFHASGDKPPYGYTIIDHATKTVFKGGEIMPLKELLAVRQVKSYFDDNGFSSAGITVTETGNDELRGYYAAILKAALYNYPDLTQGLMHQGLIISRNGEQFTLYDPSAGITVDTQDLLNEKDHGLMAAQFNQAEETGEEIYRHPTYIPEPYIAPDIDDEAVHGRKRAKKRHNNGR